MAKVKVQIVEMEAVPLCPHCSKPLDSIARKDKGFIDQTILFSCPHCNKLLGIGYNLGF